MRIRSWHLLPFALPLLASCSDASGEGVWAGTVTDSAGVPVVQNPSEGLWTAGEEWVLEEELSIGTMAGEPAYQFGQIIGVDVDADGAIYVADMQASEIRVFDASGVHLRTMGSPGAGPGELGVGVGGVFVAGDEVRVPDLGNARVTIYGRDGSFLRSYQIDVAAGVPVRWAETPDGRLMAQLRYASLTDSASAPRGDAVVILGPEGEPADTVTILPPGLQVQFVGGQPRMRMFASEPMWDAGSDGLFVSGENSGYRMEVRAPDGVLRRVVARDFEQRPVTERDQSVILNAMRDAYADLGVPPAAMTALFEQTSFADYYPVFALVLAGPEGSLWVQRIKTGEDLVGEEGEFDALDLGSNEWEVFGSEGRFLRVTEFPARFQPLRTLRDRFYGVARDELDVQSLKVYRLVR